MKYIRKKMSNGVMSYWKVDSKGKKKRISKDAYDRAKKRQASAKKTTKKKTTKKKTTKKKTTKKKSTKKKSKK